MIAERFASAARLASAGGRELGISPTADAMSGIVARLTMAKNVEMHRGRAARGFKQGTKLTAWPHTR